MTIPSRQKKLNFKGFIGLATAAQLVAPAMGITYNWTGPLTNDNWNDASHWDQPQPPGSALNGGALDDDVIIQNQFAAGTGTQNVRLTNDAGTIGSLTIGGATGTGGNTNFQVRGNAANLIVTGDVNLGGINGGGLLRNGVFQMNNANSQVTVQGNFVSVNASGGSRLVLDGGTGANLNLLGTIDPTNGKRLDLWINRENALTTTAGITMNVDNFRVGNSFNGSRTGSTRAWTLDDNRTIEANTFNVGFLDGNNATDYLVEGTFNLTNGTMNVSGNSNVGQTNAATATGERDAVGTFNIGANGTYSGGLLNVGQMALATINAGSTSEGTVNLTDATADVDVATVNVGTQLRAEGTININAGTFDSAGRLYIAGDETNGNDEATRGTVNVGPAGTLTVASGNTEVGRGGTGFLNVDGGTFNQVASNLVLGQSRGAGATQTATGTVTFTNGAQVTIGTGNNDINFNRGGGSIVQSGAGTVVNVGRNINMNDEGSSVSGAFSSSYTLDDGTLNVGTGNVEGDFNVANFAGANSSVTINGGTLNVQDTMALATNASAESGSLTITDGDVNIGIGGTNRNLNLSSGTGEGTLTVSGGTLDVAGLLDFRAGTGTDTMNVLGVAQITIGSHLDLDGGSVANNNLLNITGSDASITVGGNVRLDNSSQVTFALDSNGVTKIDADGLLNITNADLFVDFGAAGLSSADTLGDIDLINADGTINGVFSNVAFGDTVQTFGDSSEYILSQGLSDNGTTGVFLEAVPEPSSAMLLLLSGLAVLRRRRS